MERATAKEKEMEELRKRQELKVQAAMRKNKEREEKVLRENNESLALLFNENKAELAALVEKQEKVERVARKRKSDGPAAPECPVGESFYISYLVPCLYLQFHVSAVGLFD